MPSSCTVSATPSATRAITSTSSTASTRTICSIRARRSIAVDEHPNVRRHELRSGLGWLSPLLTQQTGHPLLKGAKIRRLLRDHDYDVIHYHNTSLLGPAVLAMDTPAKRAVKLYTTHEHWLVCPMHVLWKFDRAPLR